MGEFRAELFDKLARTAHLENPGGEFGGDPAVNNQKIKEFKDTVFELLMFRARDFLRRTQQSRVSAASIELLFSDKWFEHHPDAPHDIHTPPMVALAWTDESGSLEDVDAQRARGRLKNALLPCD